MLGQVFEFINTAIDMFLHEVSGPSSQISDPNHFKQKFFSKAYDADFFLFLPFQNGKKCPWIDL